MFVSIGRELEERRGGARSDGVCWRRCVWRGRRRRGEEDIYTVCAEVAKCWGRAGGGRDGVHVWSVVRRSVMKGGGDKQRERWKIVGEKEVNFK